MRFEPAQPNSGLVFVRSDLPKIARITVNPANLATQFDRRTTLRDGSILINTTEHVLAAINGLGIDNLVIDVDTEEIPGTEGSPKPFADALVQAGLAEQDAEKRLFLLDEPVTVRDGDASLTVLPGPGDYLDILYDLDYPDVPSIGRQVLGFRLHVDDFTTDIAPARTFLLKAEAEEFRSRGWGEHLSATDLLVMGDDGPVDNELRFVDEHARHKVADLIGDLALLGRPLRGRVVAHKSGHRLNHKLVARLAEIDAARRRAAAMVHPPQIDIRQIMRVLPHRYPFLMIDRVVEIVGDQKAVGVKNVSINEPFFQGHYPGEPIMPGVMILEAMAQLSGMLLSQRLEHTGKVAVLLSMDRAKMRRPVRPGDQLIIEAEALHVRTRTGHCRCRAMVGGELASEAEIKFMLVDAEPV